MQTSELIEHYTQLSQHFDQNRQTLTINASGHGAHNIFNCKPSAPTHGDLVLLKVPTKHITPHIKNISYYSFWAGGTNYAFFPPSLTR